MTVEDVCDVVCDADDDVSGRAENLVSLGMDVMNDQMTCLFGQLSHVFDTSTRKIKAAIDSTNQRSPHLL